MAQWGSCDLVLTDFMEDFETLDCARCSVREAGIRAQEGKVRDGHTWGSCVQSWLRCCRADYIVATGQTPCTSAALMAWIVSLKIHRLKCKEKKTCIEDRVIRETVMLNNALNRTELEEWATMKHSALNETPISTHAPHGSSNITREGEADSWAQGRNGVNPCLLNMTWWWFHCECTEDVSAFTQLSQSTFRHRWQKDM